MTTKTLQKNIPKGWKKRKLDNYVEDGLIQLSRGNVISKKDIAANPGSNPIYSSSVQRGGLFGTYGDYMFDEELITWSIDGGGNFFYRPRHKFSVTNVSGILRADTKEFDYRFLAYLFDWEHRNFRFDYQAKAHPSVIRQLYYIYQPPLPEQKKIAEILGTVDEEIQKTGEIIAATEKLKKGLMRNIFTRGIGHTKFKKTEIGEIPEEWEVAALKTRIKSLDAGVSVNSQDRPKQLGEIGILKTSAVTFGTFDSSQHKVVNENEKGRLAMSVRGNRIIISRMNTRDLVGANAYVSKDFDDLFLPDRLWQVEPFDDSTISMLWLSYIFNLLWRGGIFSRLATGTSASMKNLSKGKVLSVQVAFPLVKEQRKIAEILSSIDEKIVINQKLKAKLTLLKKGLMQDLLSGKKRVTV